MFDISFFELLVIGVVALVVIGPEKLPGTVRTCALWIGRIKRNLLDTRREIEKHIGADEIRRELYNEQVLHNMEKMKDTRLELEAKIRALESGNLIAEQPPVVERTDETHAVPADAMPAPAISNAAAPVAPAPTAAVSPAAPMPPPAVTTAHDHPPSKH